MIKLILVIALLSLSGLTMAACQRTEYTDLRSAHVEIFKRIPIKQQGNYGLCYSYAGTTLVDYYRMKLGRPQYSNISPLEAAVLSTIYANSDSEEGGDICHVIKALSARGSACTESIVGSEARYKDLGAVFHQNMVEQVFMPFLIKTEEFKEVSAAKFASRGGLNKTQTKYLARFDAFYKVLKPNIASHRFTKETIPTASEVFLMAQRIHLQNKYNLLGPSFIQLLLDKSCTVRSIAIPKISCETHSGSPDALMGDIDRQISEKQPVGISYCSVMLSEKGANGLDYSGKIKSNCGAHGSVIIGRKGDSSGSCQYLIRKSNGDIWVSEYQLKRNIFWVHVVND